MHRLLEVTCLVFVAMALGCSHAPREQTHTGDKTREVVASATQRLKPEIKWTARKTGQAAEWATEETLAAIEGFIEGWFRPSLAPINVNSATERQLESLPEVTAEEAHRIVHARP